MRELERRDLERRLAALPSNEKQKIYKRAAAMRGRGKKPPRERGGSLEERVLALLREEDALPDQASPEAAGASGTVVWIGSGACAVREGDAVTSCATPRDGRAVAVGDEVIFAGGEGARVLAVRPRRTVLSRPDPHDGRRELVIAANVDVVVIVAALLYPPLRPGLLDRFLVAIQRGGAEAAICVSKIDQVPPEDRDEALRALDPYAALGVPIAVCSAATGEGIVEARALVLGRTAAFVGHSGVGKSSLANALHPALALATGAVSAHHGRGRHTTTSAALHVLPDGSRLLDTPGIRSFGLWDVRPEELGAFFPDLAEHAVRCRFGDCAHDREPRCAVRDAVEQGLLSRARHEAYLRILGTMDDEK